MNGPLGFAVRPGVVLGHLGDLLVAVGVLSAVPLALAIGFGEPLLAAVQAGVALAFVAAGFGLRRLRPKAGVQRNEALAVAALAFLIAPLATAPLYVAAGHPWADALFEAISGVTTTGLSTLPSVEDASPAFLLTRAWTQWYGGLGIVVLTLVLSARSGLLARRLEPAGPEERDIASSTRLHALRITRVYLVLTAAGVALLATAGTGVLDAFAYTLSAVSTGGFAPHDASLAALHGWPRQALVVLLSASGAVSLPLYLMARRKGLRAAARDPELRVLAACAVAVSALLALGMALEGRPVGSILRHAPLLGVSGQTTTGFASLPIRELDGFSKAVLALAMSIGGCVGSTAGGIKILRLIVIAKVVRSAFRRMRLPEHAVEEPRVAGAVLDTATIRGAVVLAFLFALVTVASWLVFLAYGYDPLDSLFEVVSAAGTVGLSTGIARPGLEGPLKGILCADMLLGRLEIVAVLVVLSPATWFGRRAVE
jgi:trk system potassium uptake protein TrkH